MKMKTALAIGMLLISVNMFAQHFMPPLSQEGLLSCKEAHATTSDGQVISGRITFAMIINGQLRSFTIKDADKVKHKFKAADVVELKVKPSQMANFESAFSAPNLIAQINTDVGAVMNREWVYYERALLHKKNSKPVLMQLLNKGFDSKIKVYLDPNAKETASLGGITGGIDKSYLVVKGGEKSMLIKKGKYKKEAMSQLYDNCEVLAQHYEGEKFAWRDFAEHVFVYDQMCGKD